MVSTLFKILQWDFLPVVLNILNYRSNSNLTIMHTLVLTAFMTTYTKHLEVCVKLVCGFRSVSTSPKNTNHMNNVTSILVIFKRHKLNKQEKWVITSSLEVAFFRSGLRLFLS